MNLRIFGKKTDFTAADGEWLYETRVWRCNSFAAADYVSVGKYVRAFLTWQIGTGSSNILSSPHIAGPCKELFYSFRTW